jgi:hypothetical protein
MARTPEELAEELEQWGQTAAATRLRALSAPDRAQAWETIDLWRVLNPGRLASAVESAYLRCSSSDVQRSISRREAIRNVLVLVPITVTWILLAFATHSYQQQIANHPELSGQPFLLLWQQGFEQTWWERLLAFSNVAFLDFGVLLIVIGYTIAVQRDAGNLQRQHAEQARAKAEALREDLETVLYAAELDLGQQRTEHTTAQFGRIAEDIGAMSRAIQEPLVHSLESFTYASGELVRQLEQTSQHLEAMSEREEAEISGLSAFAKRLDRAAKVFSGETPALLRSLTDAAHRVEELVTQQANLVRPLEQRLDMIAMGLNGLNMHAATLQTTLDTSATTFARSATLGDAALQALVNSIRVFDATAQGVTASNEQVTRIACATEQGQERHAQLLASTGGTLEAMQTALMGLHGANDVLHSRLKDDGDRLAQALVEQQAQLGALLNSTNGFQRSLDATVRELPGVIRTVGEPLYQSAHALQLAADELGTASAQQRSYTSQLDQAIDRQRQLLDMAEALKSALEVAHKALAKGASASGEVAGYQKETHAALLKLQHGLAALEHTFAEDLKQRNDPETISRALAVAWRDVQGDWLAALRTVTHAPSPVQVSDQPTPLTNGADRPAPPRTLRASIFDSRDRNP